MQIIGMDVHKSKCSLCVQDETGKLLFEKTILTTRERLTEVMAPLSPARVLMESSTTAQWVSRHLEMLGLEVIVANPNFAPMYATLDTKVKTDRRDARALADALRMGAYRRAHRLSDERQRVREVLAARDMLVAQRGQMVVLVRAQCEKLGVRLVRCEAEAFWRRVRPDIPALLRPSVRPLLDALAGLEDQLRALDRELEAFATDPIVQLLMTMPGVGIIAALTFLSVLDTPARFSGAHQAECYLGVVPSENSSGARRARGAITKAGSSDARRQLCQAAWALVRSKSPDALPLQKWFAAVAARRGNKVAITGLMRRMAGILFAMWRDGRPFAVENTVDRRAERKTYRLSA